MGNGGSQVTEGDASLQILRRRWTRDSTAAPRTAGSRGSWSREVSAGLSKKLVQKAAERRVPAAFPESFAYIHPPGTGAHVPHDGAQFKSCKGWFCCTAPTARPGQGPRASSSCLLWDSAFPGAGAARPRHGWIHSSGLMPICLLHLLLQK